MDTVARLSVYETIHPQSGGPGLRIAVDWDTGSEQDAIDLLDLLYERAKRQIREHQQ